MNPERWVKSKLLTGCLRKNITVEASHCQGGVTVRWFAGPTWIEIAQNTEYWDIM